MEVPKKKIIRIKTKEEVLLLQRQEQRQVAPMFLAEGSVKTLAEGSVKTLAEGSVPLAKGSVPLAEGSVPLAKGSVAEPSKPVVTKPSETPVACSKEQEFLNTLDEKELIAYNIAKSHLGLLFSLDRSNCYLEWLNKT